MFLHLTTMVFFERYMCFFHSPEGAGLDENEPFLAWKLLVAGNMPCKHQLNYHRETMCYMLHLVTWLLFVGETDVIPQISWKGLFGANEGYVHLETPKMHEVFLSKLTQFSQKKNVLHAPASNTEGFPQKIQVFHQLPWTYLYRTQVPFSTLKPLICRNCSLQKPSQVSEENNVLDLLLLR
jgi:hypothetical protein